MDIFTREEVVREVVECLQDIADGSQQVPYKEMGLCYNIAFMAPIRVEALCLIFNEYPGRAPTKDTYRFVDYCAGSGRRSPDLLGAEITPYVWGEDEYDDNTILWEGEPLARRLKLAQWLADWLEEFAFDEWGIVL